MSAERPPRQVRDREVLIAAALVVVGVVAFARLAGFVPALNDLIAFGPAVIAGLVAVTLLVLLSALRPRR